MEYGSIESIELCQGGGFMKSFVTAEDFEGKIYLVRGQKVMLDA